MARLTGRFSRRFGGSSQNLSALIASLLREQQASEDRQMSDAYRNGGLIDGKPVTDQAFLDYILSRRDSYTQGDPAWTEWNNSYLQQVQNIGEGKMALQYQQGTATAEQVAAFYDSQLAGLDPNSEQYRQIATAAANWRNRAKNDESGEQAKRDKAMFDAWQGGGEIDGQPVSDDRILAYIQERMATFNPGEAGWQQWNVLLTQTKSGIEEKKIATLYKQGKIKIADVAKFYEDQLATLDLNSDYGREIAGKAGEWRKAATDEETAEKLKKTAAMDKLMFEAFEKPGQLVDGKPVDDKRLLAYIKERRDSFDKTDPAWQEWDNTLRSTDFTIKERKIQTDFLQGEVSAKAVAKFYADALKKYGEDSAFGGTIAKNAADWAKFARDQAEANAARARAAAEKALRDKYDAQQKKLQNTLTAYTGVENAILRAAQEKKGFTGTDLSQMDASDLMDLLDSGAVMGADGTPITYSEWQQANIAAFNANKTYIGLGEKLGYEMSGARTAGDNLWGTLTRINAVDERSLYEEAYAVYLSKMEAANGDTIKQDKINKEFAEQLRVLYGNIVSDTGTAQNAGIFAAAILNDISLLTSGTANGTTMSGIVTGGNGLDSTDKAGVSNMAQHFANVEGLRNGTMYQTQLTPRGPLETVPLEVNQKIDPNTGFVTGMGADTAPFVEKEGYPVYLKGEPVKSVVYYYPATGAPVDPKDVTPEDIRTDRIRKTGDETVVGFVFATPSGQTKYGVYAPDGTLRFTDTNPFTNLVKGESGFEAISVGRVETAPTGAAPGRDPSVLPSTIVTNTDSWLKPDALINADVILTSPTIAKGEVLNKALTGAIPLTPSQIDYLTKTVNRNVRSGQEMSNVNMLRTGERGAQDPTSQQFAMQGAKTAAGDVGAWLEGLAPGLGALGDGLRAVFDVIRGGTQTTKPTGLPTSGYFNAAPVGTPTTVYSQAGIPYAPAAPGGSYSPPSITYTGTQFAPPKINTAPTSGLTYTGIQYSQAGIPYTPLKTPTTGIQYSQAGIPYTPAKTTTTVPTGGATKLKLLEGMAG